MTIAFDSHETGSNDKRRNWERGINFSVRWNKAAHAALTGQQRFQCFQEL
jgi:hypothetical protein